MSRKLTLYHYWRSSSSWRVRWAFAFKNIECEFVHVDLLNGEVEGAAHLARNPLGYVPALEIKQDNSPSLFLAESVSLIEWSEEICPTPTLYPGDAISRARVRQCVEIINADTQPLQNLNPQHLHSDDPEKRKKWAQHWIKNGLRAYEKVCKPYSGKFSIGSQLTAADLLLIPQLYNANRFDVEISPFLQSIWDNCKTLDSYIATEPDRFKP